MDRKVFDEVQAQATEVVGALIQGSLGRWIDVRMDCSGHNLYSYWSDFDSKKMRYFQRRIADFSKTLRGVRVTEVSGHYAVYPKGYGRAYPNEAKRAVHFSLGNSAYPSQIKIQIAFDEEDDPHQGNIWGEWIPSQGLAVVCLQHPKEKYVGKVLLGAIALDQSS